MGKMSYLPIKEKGLYPLEIVQGIHRPLYISSAAAAFRRVIRAWWERTTPGICHYNELLISESSVLWGQE